MSKKKTEYEREKAVWYKKLKDEGFKDIEQDGGSINIGLPRSVNWNDSDLRQITQDYYCMAYHFLNEYKFGSKREKIIWEYHTEGLSIRNIVKVLKKASLKNVNRVNVWEVVHRLDGVMKGMYLST